MTDHKTPKENSGNETSVSNPKAPGKSERVDPTTGGSAGTIDSGHAQR